MGSICLAKSVQIACLIFGALVLAPAAGCSRSGPGAECSYRTWQGMCQLKSVSRVRLVESMPAISIMEGLYEAQDTQVGQTLLPPNSRQEFSVRAEQEFELRGHLEKHGMVPCRYQEKAGGSCADGRLVVEVPAFVPSAAPDVRADAGPPESGGCAELDQGQPAAQGAAAELPAGAPVEIFFQADSSESTPEIEKEAAKVAEALQAHPDIQCLAVVGHVTSGERVILGDERAALVKNLLVSRGVPSHRLQTIAAVVPMAGGAPRAVIEADRKVRLRVLKRAAQ
jgi:outer membrane protein OmpA-like peptidoglycan-associated protein